MAFLNGNFDATAFGKTITLQTDLLGDASRMTELSKPIVAGAAILMNQNPTIDENLQGAGKRCINAKISVMRSGSGFRENKTISCDTPSGILGGTESIDVTKELLLNPYSFTIMDDQCANQADYATKYAYMSLAAKINIEVELSKLLVGLAASNADTQDAANYETEGTAVADTFNVTKSNFTPELLADIVTAGVSTGMMSPIILNGRNFHNDKILTEFESQGCCSKNSMLNSSNYFQFYWDLLNVDQTLGGNYTLCLDKNSLYFWSSPINVNVAPERVANDTFRFAESLPRLKYMANNVLNDIIVDITAKQICVITNGIKTYGMNYEYLVYGAAGANHVNHYGKKGIFKIKKIAA
jgi:hypothetical protein